MHAILTTSPSGHAPLPPALARVVDGCLEKDPEKRLPSIREAAAALAAASSPGSARRTGWWALAASTAIIAAIVAAAVTFGSRHGPPAVGASGRPALAIVTFDDHSGDPALAWLSSGIPGMLVTSLPQTPGLDVIGSERLAASFSELGRAPTNRGADSEVARRAGAGAVLHGSIFKVGSDIRLDVQVQDVDTGRVVAARTEQGKDVFVLVDAIGGAVRAALDVANRPAGRPVRDVTTASIDAYELYTKAQQARHNNRWNDARTLFQEALRVDPAFTLARAQLVNVLERVGEGAAALVERRTVIDQLDRLPDRQRLMVEALQEYDRNPARAVELLERLLHQYPDEEEAYDAIIHAYTHARDPGYLQKTLAFMQRWERAIPGPGSGHFHNHYGYVYVDHGLFTEAEREFRAYIRVSPDEANAYDSLAELFLMTGRPAQAVDTYDRALRLNPLFGWSHFGRAYALGMQGRYDDAFSALMTLQNLGQRAGVPPAVIHMLEGLAYSRVGRDAEAAEHLDTVRRLARQQDDVGTEADIDLIDAALAVERGQRARAIEYADRARTSATRTQLDIMRARRTAVAYLLAGMAESRAGRLAAAHRLLELQQKLDVGGDPTQVSWQRALAGEIALAEHRFDDAEAAFRAAEFQPGSSFAIYPAAVALANNLPFRDGLARTARARGDTVRAIDLYRRLNQPDSGSKWMSLYDPRYAQAATELTAYAPAVSPISKSPR
jgi:tetratricopeptide (TPR) repeat protein